VGHAPEPLSARRVFYTETGAFRALWRLLFFSLASLAALFVAELVLAPMIKLVFPSANPGDLTPQMWISTVAVIGGTAISVRWVDKRPWRDVWLGREASRPSLLVSGFVIGAAAVSVPCLTLIAAHWLRLQTGVPGSLVGAGLRITLVLLPAALFEELISRGYILSVLRECWGWQWAIAATSVGFGMLHLANNGVTVQSIALVTLAGFFLAGVVYATKSLYAAWMAHFAWNWMMAAIFHTAVSGIPLEAPRYRYVDAGPDWATGGVWGPEGGLPAGLGMAGGIVYLFVLRGRGSRRRET
jgi:uncharacterized protein